MKWVLIQILKIRTGWFKSSQPPQVRLQESFDSVDEESSTNDINIQIGQ